jgi:hypothetical protein
MSVGILGNSDDKSKDSIFIYHFIHRHLNKLDQLDNVGAKTGF